LDCLSGSGLFSTHRKYQRFLFFCDPEYRLRLRGRLDIGTAGALFENRAEEADIIGTEFGTETGHGHLRRLF
jgi:hypothetical protein